jgi:hypothetical protein
MVSASGHRVENTVLMTPLSRMTLVSLYCAMIWINACELDAFAKVITTLHAKKAFAARNAWLDSDAVTYMSSGYCKSTAVRAVYSPFSRFVTPSPHSRTIPAAS